MDYIFSYGDSAIKIFNIFIYNISNFFYIIVKSRGNYEFNNCFRFY